MATRKTPAGALADVFPIERIASGIFLIGRKKVIFDFDLAILYGVPAKVLNQAVTRDADRFPDDFMFRQKHRD